MVLATRILNNVYNICILVPTYFIFSWTKYRWFVCSVLNNDVTNVNFTVKGSFDAANKIQEIPKELFVANKIQEIPKELFDSGYKFLSFDVASLYTNVPLAKAIDIILKRVYREKIVTTNSSKRAMKSF